MTALASAPPVLDIRARRMVPMTLACLTVLGLSVLLADPVPVLWRDFLADPWHVLFCLPSCVLVSCLDPRLDYMEAGLARPAWQRRARVLVAVHAVLAVCILSSAASLGRDPWAALSAVLWVSALAGLLATYGGVVPAVLGPVTFVALNWIFGLDELQQEAHPWALLMMPPSPARVALAAVVGVLVLGWWARRGTRSTD